MKAGILLALCARLSWASGDLSSVPEPEPGTVLHGTTVSPGSGRRVSARVTFDRSRAASGGCILALPGLSPADEAAARMSEALLLTSGGRLGRGAVLARARRMPALVLDGARWEGGSLVVEQPVFGKTQKSGDLSYQVADQTALVKLKEGDALTLDPERGVLVVHPESEAAAVLAAAEAARAYDGLRDGQALAQWWESHRESEPRAGVFLVCALAERLAAGSARPEDLVSLRRAVASALPKPEKARLETEERRILREAARGTEAFLRDALGGVKDAATVMAVEHALAQAEPRRQGLEGLAEALGRGSEAKAAAGLWHELERAAAERRQGLPKSEPDDGLAAAAKAVGAQVPQRAVLGPEFYRRFMAENSLQRRVDELSGDASLGLRRRSERIRTLILGARIADSSSLGQDILGLVPQARDCSVSCAYDSFPDVPRSELLARMVECWAAGFDPGPLGARKRAAADGLAAEPEAGLVVAAKVPLDSSGTVFSRDPVSGRRGRIVVTAAKAGDRADEYTLERRTGREVLPAALGSGERLVSAGELARLARAGRALDDHNGRGMELDFGVAQGELYLLGARPLSGSGEEPARAAPFTVTVPTQATIPGVKSLR